MSFHFLFTETGSSFVLMDAPQAIVMKPLPLAAFALLTPIMALAGIDQPWNETDDGGNGSVVVGMVVLAILAFIIHLIEKGEFLVFLKDIAIGMSFLATIYLVGFWFAACIVVSALLLRGLGMDEGTSGIIALPVALFAAYKIFCVYQDWRNLKPKDTP